MTWIVAGGTLLAVGCEAGVGPSERESGALGLDGLCGESTGEQVFFQDAGLEAAVRAAVRVSADEALTCNLVASIGELDASFSGIATLDGIESLRGLRLLTLWGNELSDIDPLGQLVGLTSISLRSNQLSDITILAGLPSLSDVDLGANTIADIAPLAALRELRTLLVSDNLVTDVAPLRGLSRLTNLNLQGNAALSDIAPLLDNAGLGPGSAVRLIGTSVSCTDVGALEAKGVEVVSDCP